jgi:hypothetical protein
MLVPALLALGVAALVAGCGGGTLTLSGPVVSAPMITTAPTPMTAAGGTAAVRVTITSASLLNLATSPPAVDVTDTSGASLLGGRQPLVSLNSDPTAWAFQFSVPSNVGGAVPKVYRITIYAQSIGGATGNTPFFAGAVTVPNR